MKKINMKKILTLGSTLFVLPLITLAAEPKNFKELIDNVFIGGLIQPIVPLLIGLAVVVFVYGVLTMVLSEGGEKKEDGKKYMLWGIIGIFVMVSVWGLVNILQGTFGLQNNPVEIKPIKVNLP
jgi:hypothetical protein